MSKKLTVAQSMTDLKRAHSAKSKLIERQREDFLFALGDQWNKKDLDILQQAGVKPITDNRIAPNIFLLTGLERQNRTDFKAFPEGEEDGIKAEIASYLFKHSIKSSDFSYKSSDQFKDGVTCGESHLELWLDYTDNMLNGKPSWRKLDSDTVFPEPGFSEYDFRDCRYVYKIVKDIPRDELINLFPKKKAAINKAKSGRLDLGTLLSADGTHEQKRDYPKSGEGRDTGSGESGADDGFDLIERYYRKWVKNVFIADKQTGEIKQADDMEKAEEFIANYQGQIVSDQQAYDMAVQQALASVPVDPLVGPVDPNQIVASLTQEGVIPPPPPQRDPERFILIKRDVPEIWCFAHVPGIEEPLEDARAWFYPKWKQYPFVPYYARFSTAPLTGDDRHLLVQGIVHAVKGVQEKHNKAEMLMLRHLNSSANSGWISEEDTWVDPSKVEMFGSAPGVNLEYKKGKQRPERIQPMQLSTAHAAISGESAEAIKAQLGINSDLLATQQSNDSGRAIALRQKQGLLMIQELFDNLSRSRMIAGRFLLSQLGEIYDTETAKKVLGEAFLVKAFPPPTLLNEMTGQPEPVIDQKTGQPMQYDAEMAKVAIAEVLAGDLEKYNVSVGEGVSSETERMANAMEIKELSAAMPGIVPPDVVIEESQLSQSSKTKILSSMRQAQAMAQAGAGPMPVNAGKGEANA
jgi:hypothetical protein